MIFKKTAVAFLAICSSFTISAQSERWENVRDRSQNFFEIQRAFNETYRGVDLSTIKGWKPYKRWEYYYESRTFPHGDLNIYRNALLEFDQQLRLNPNPLRTTASNWQFIGPNIIPSNGGGAGRLNHVKLIPGTTNQFMAASPGGGMWKFDGTNWSTSTDFLSRIGFGDVVIHPTSPNIMYATSGDNDNADAPCIGLFKSTDGGNSWSLSGLTSVTRMYKIIMSPANPDILLVASNSGIYRSSNAGSAWSQVSTLNNVRDLEFMPGNPDIIYAANRNDNNIFYRSTNGGLSFSSAGVGAGLPVSSNGRGALAVTPHDPNYIYLIIGNPSNNGFKGVYRSTDGGINWVTQATTPNLLGWSSTGSDTGGQQWYDLAIAVSPTNKDLVITGGVNVWRSLDGGATWQIAGHWTGSGAPYIHADIHDLNFDDNGITMYAGCDGGIFKKTDITSNSNPWTDLSSGLANSQMYRMGQSTQSQNKILSGWQDNGTNLWTGPNTWTRPIGGDGMECIIDYSTDTYQYGELYYGNIRRSSNGGISFSTIVSSGGTAGTVGEDGDWVTPYVLNPRNPLALYVGKTRIYKSVNRGSNWVTHPLIGSSSSRIDAIAIGISDTSVIYASKSGQIWRSVDDGANYAEITNGLPGSFISYIAVDESDANKVYVTLSGTSAGNKVFVSVNGGNSWTNISAGLPNLPANTIVLDTTSVVNAMYVGMDAGVYYRDDNNPTWALFNTNLPNVEVTELEIQYAAQKIRASTYGRGIWESNLESAITNFVTASFTSGATNICRGASVQFTDNSTGNPAPNSWTWSFPGGTPSGSTQKNPLITYNTNGTYAVSLTVGNGTNSNTITLNGYITVTSVTPSLLLSGNSEVCAGSTASYIAAGTNTGSSPVYSWSVNGTPAGINAATFSSAALANNSVITCQVTSNAACAQPATVTSNSITLVVKPVPPKPIITAVFGLLTSSNPTGNQWMFNGSDIPGATNVTYNAIRDGKYSVRTTVNGCTSASSDEHNVQVENVFKIYPVPTTGDLNMAFFIPENTSRYAIRILNSLGQLVYTEETSAGPGVATKVLDLKRLGAGVYHLKIVAGEKKYNRSFVKATQ